MPRGQRFAFDESGTRFRVYLQPRFLDGFHEPATVHVNSRPGTITKGPRDHRIHVIDACGKPPYKDEATLKTRWRPPYPADAPRFPPARPGRDGHFDTLDVRTRAFSAAMAFATVRCVLEIWEHYFERPLPWFFRDTYESLEVIPRVESGNGWSGEGFVEFGYGDPARRRDPLCNNFDAVAHETGHLILKAVIGNPTDDKKTLEYRAHEEACADLVSLVAALHFEPVLTHVLRHTQGKLFSVNELSRIGELAEGGDIREAFNRARMSSPAIRRADAQYESHGFALPFCGAAFDVLVAIYEGELAERGVIPRELARRAYRAPARALGGLQRDFARHFARAPREFEEALREARHRFARLLARTWDTTPVEGFSYGRAAATMMAAARAVRQPAYVDVIGELFEAREIVPAE